jgi:hypothetical protein
MIKTIHPLAGALALFTIATFWLSTASAELYASEATVIIVKTTTWGFLVLIPALMAAGGSGFTLAGKRRGGIIGTKTGACR